MNRADTGSLWVANLVSPQGAGKYLVVADDGYVAGVRARQIAAEAGLAGRGLEVFMAHVCHMPAGTITLGSTVMRRHAADSGVDLDVVDSSYLSAIYVTPFGRWMLAQEAEVCDCGDDRSNGADHGRCHLI